MNADASALTSMTSDGALTTALNRCRGIGYVYYPDNPTLIRDTSKFGNALFSQGKLRDHRDVEAG